MARHRQSSPEYPFVLYTRDNVPCGEDAPAAATEVVNMTIPEPEDTDDVGPATPHSWRRTPAWPRHRPSSARRRLTTGARSFRPPPTL